MARDTSKDPVSKFKVGDRVEYNGKFGTVEYSYSNESRIDFDTEYSLKIEKYINNKDLNLATDQTIPANSNKDKISCDGCGELFCDGSYEACTYYDVYSHVESYGVCRCLGSFHSGCKRVTGKKESELSYNTKFKYGQEVFYVYKEEKRIGYEPLQCLYCDNTKKVTLKEELFICPACHGKANDKMPVYKYSYVCNETPASISGFDFLATVKKYQVEKSSFEPRFVKENMIFLTKEEAEEKCRKLNIKEGLNKT